MQQVAIYFCNTIQVLTENIIKNFCPFVVHFKCGSSSYVVHITWRDCPYIVHSKHMDCPYIKSLPYIIFLPV